MNTSKRTTKADPSITTTPRRFRTKSAELTTTTITTSTPDGNTGDKPSVIRSSSHPSIFTVPPSPSPATDSKHTTSASAETRPRNGTTACSTRTSETGEPMPLPSAARDNYTVSSPRSLGHPKRLENGTQRAGRQNLATPWTAVISSATTPVSNSHSPKPDASSENHLENLVCSSNKLTDFT